MLDILKKYILERLFNCKKKKQKSNLFIKKYSKK